MIEESSKNGAVAEAARDGVIRLPFIRLRRLLFFGLVLGTTLSGTAVLLRVVAADGPTPLEWLILPLFAATFGWISLAFWTAVAGFVLMLLRRDGLTLERTPDAGPDPRPITSRTALVMPVRNEDPTRVTRGLAAILRSLRRMGVLHHFDVFLLSDTAEGPLAEAEEAAWAALRGQFAGSTALYYRRRGRNVGRKAGNIADFCRRWGTHYELMVVLDADSIMSGRTIVELVSAMEANPRAGLIQTMPIPARQQTLFGRALQFARCLYGPMIATGITFWQADTGNYWGHNAIVRVRPFTEHCGLPVLPGRPPLGGEILSHDFVEAALLRRAGWRVYLFPTTGGSWEEVPGNLLDYAARDRRWSTGNLQHLRLLSMSGLHPINRLHFVLGAMGYLSSALWLLMLLAGTVNALLLHPGAASGPEGALVVRGWAPRGTSFVHVLLVAIVAVLFLPKVLAVVLALLRGRHLFGGAGRLLASALLETVFTVVVAPLLMVFHGQFLISVLRGRNVRWESPPRGGRAVSWTEAWRKTRGVTVAAGAWAAAALFYGPGLFLWLSPILVGLLFSAPLVRWTSRRSAGRWARRLGLFLVPSETAPPPVLEKSSWRVVPSTVAESARAGAWPLPPERPRAMTPQVLGARREPRGSLFRGSTAR